MDDTDGTELETIGWLESGDLTVPFAISKPDDFSRDRSVVDNQANA